MKHKTLSSKDLGIIILSKFYLFLAALHLLPLYVFSTTVYLFGQKLNYFPTYLAAALYITFLYFLYDAIRRIKFIGFFLALVFQLVFLINNSQILFDQTPFLDIKGEKIAFLTAEKSIIIVSIIVNILISSLLIYYLYIFLKRLYKHRARRLKK